MISAIHRSRLVTLRQQPRPYVTGLILMATCLANLPRVGAEPLPAATSAAQVMNRDWRALRLTAETADLMGRHARIFLRLNFSRQPGDQTRVQWRNRSGQSGNLSAPDWRSLVFEGVIARPVFDGLVELAALCSLPEQTEIAVAAHFEIEAVDPAGGAKSRQAVSSPVDDAISLSLPCTGRTADRWSDTDAAGTVPTDGLAVEPGSRGVRVERRFNRQRIAFSPEATTNHGIQLGGGVATVVPGGAAGVLLAAGPEKREVVVNSLWSVPRGTVFLTLGRQSQYLTLSSNEAAGKNWVTQRGGGAGYAFTWPGAWSAQLGGEAYAYATDSRDLASVEYTQDDGDTEQFFVRHDRLAGSMLTGFQSRASFSPLRGSTANLALGREEVTFDFAAGDQVTRTVTRGLSWSQQLPGRLNLTVGEHLYSSHVARSLSLGHSSTDGRRQMSIDITSRRGRDGAPDDTQLRIGYAIAFGPSAGPATTNVRPATDSAANGALSQVSARPSYMPYMPMATLDNTVVPTRLVVIDKHAIPESASIDGVTGTVTVPTDLEGILRVQRNGEPFTNTGQFTLADGRLLVHPRAMEEPSSGQTHLYVVTLQSSPTTVTDVNIRIEKGSVRVASITIDPPRPAEPDAEMPPPAPAPVPPAPDNPPAVPPVPTPTPTPAPVPPPSAAPEPDDSPEEEDKTPDSFSFTAQTGVARNATVTSNTVTVAGLNAPATIKVSGGEYAINGDSFRASAGTVGNGQRVVVRVTASSAYATTTSVTVTIGGVAGAFSVTTEAAPSDITPDSFSFAAQTGATPGATVTSNTVTVAGITATAAITVSGGEYAISGGAYTANAGTVSNGQTVTVRLTASAGYASTTAVTLTIGGVSGAFSVTTRAADTTPNPFSFTSQTGVALNTHIVSNATTITGIEAAAAISISGGDYAIDGGSYTSAAGTVSNGQSVTVRQRSANQYSSTSTVTLTVGGVPGTFSVTTAAPDTTPDAYSFTSQSNVAPSTAIVSNTITISGINSASPVSVAGGEYAIQGNSYTSAPGTISSGETIKVRVTSPAGFSATATVTLTIGGVSGTFVVTTAARDTTPNAFSFAAETNVNLNQLRTSEAITVGGINSAATISVSGASSSEYKINNGSWSTAAGTVSNGDTVRVRHTSASTNLTSTTTILTIGGVSGTFATTTKP